MEYLLLLHSDDSAFAQMPDATKAQAMGAYRAYTEAIQKAGICRSVNRLQPDSASTVVRVKGEKTEVQNGPFAETRESLGGYYLIDVPDLDNARPMARSKCVRSGR
jgi:hypothetical protein